MSRTLLAATVTGALLTTTALAEVPRVAADIAPIHSLVARVMEGVGAPDLIVQPGGSPHEYALRPSEASALQEADVVFWVGSRLSPWLGEAVGTLAADAAVVELLRVDGTITLESRRTALFEKHVHGEEDHEEHAGEAGHEDHAGHTDHANHDEHEGHGDHAGHDDHADHDDHGDHDDHDDHAGHGDTTIDSHAWLSTQNAATWLNAIAGQLSAVDPENAGAYFANAAAGRAELAALDAEVKTLLEPVRGAQFVVFHDAYQYFESDFDFPAAGAISLSDASDPSPARIGEIRTRIANEGIDCVLAEPQFNAGLIATVMDGTQAATGVMDPLGSELDVGPALYPQMIRNLAVTLTGCL